MGGRDERVEVEEEDGRYGGTAGLCLLALRQSVPGRGSELFITRRVPRSSSSSSATCPSSPLPPIVVFIPYIVTSLPHT